MKLLYLSCHEALAYDEQRILAELGHSVCVIGETTGYTRPFLPPVLSEAAFVDPGSIQRAQQLLTEHGRVEKSFVDHFDAVFFVSRNDWILDNWEAVKHSRVVCRLIGQSDDGTEIRLKPFVDQGMVMLGYSPFENRRFSIFSIRHTVRFYKDPDEWKGWNGSDPSVMTACRFIDRDSECCNPTAYRRATNDIPHVLYGPGNDNFLGRQGASRILDYEDLKKAYRDHRVYFYVGTRPATYTLNFIEAWMTGIPVVSLGPRFNTYEVPELIEQGVNGFYSDDISLVEKYLKKIISDTDFAREIGSKGRQKAAEIFGKKGILEQWKSFFKSVS